MEKEQPSYLFKNIMREVFLRQNLIQELVLKDLKVRYSRLEFGFFWAFLSPFFTAMIFYIVFSLMLKVKTEETPFFLYLMSAVIPWRFFQDSVMSSVSSVVDNKNLIRESAFPQYFIPISVVLANAIIFLPSLLILIGISLFVLKGLPLFIVFLPLVLFFHLILVIGLSMIVSFLYVKWPDTKYILELLFLVLFYLSPVFYSIYLIKGMLPLNLFTLYINTPFVAVMNLYRCVLLKGFYSAIKPDVGLVSLVFVPMVFSFLLLFLGVYFYKKNKNNINDSLFN